ncbi:hypothetical protein [Psychroserpens sp. SPM9]|uniref:hypothetical protein n=1 Tax=Psychroserpens sp. SPM9 TaxID=2975598 RepID=UPI0021A920E8|nr:hypothetical protein [Psychroserpens sp. SPM9]MDG5490532.1 hypothetical protein [Psychroserpens sp. SPM9]
MKTNQLLGNDDCSLIDRLWKFLSDPASDKYYIKNIINDGLKVPSLGIDIAPFATVDVGDIPKQQMFKEPVIGYMNLTMTDTVLSGIGSYSSGNLTCKAISPTDTQVDLNVLFSSVAFSGKYDVGSGGLAGCALATGAALTGGHVHGSTLASGVTPPDNNVELAQWYRDVALPKSENGKTLVGAYYTHQDTIQKVQLANNNMSQQYRQVLAQSQQAQTKGAVVDATTFYQEEQSGSNPPGSAPKVGNGDQYSGGFAAHIALVKATAYMMGSEGYTLEDSNDYSELLNAMSQFDDNILAFQKTNPTEVDTTTIMQYVATATPVNADSKIPVFEFTQDKNGDITATQVGEKDTWPLNTALYDQTYAARVEPLVISPEDTFNIDGNFSDAAQQLKIGVTVDFSNATGTLVATAKSITMSLGSLKITISDSGWNGHESLYDKIASWIANSKFFQDILKSKMHKALNSQSTLDSFSKVLNAGIKKLGL